MAFLRNSLGAIFIAVLVAVPVLIWLQIEAMSERFSSPEASFRSLGQMAGLLGMALLSINFILSARFKFLDRLFIGLNKVYVKHHVVGVTAFCLLLLHPLFLASQFVFISFRSALLFIFSFGDWPTNLGKLSLSVFLVLMILTLFIKLRYQIWKGTHQYLGITLALATVHILLIPSDVANNKILRYYMLSLASLGLVSYLYRTALQIYKINEHEYRLKEVIKAGENISELRFVPAEKGMKFLAGQFVFLRFNQKGILSESHPFSISTYPKEEELGIGVKTLGDYTSAIQKLKPGAVCKIEGPFGAFSYEKAKSRRQVWVAGGIGITPFLGMARQIGASDGEYRIDLFYSVKNRRELAFNRELKEIAERNGNFRYYEHFSDESGHITADKIAGKAGGIKEAEIFLCGPVKFMQSLRAQFLKMGVKNESIHSEEFNLYF